MFKIKRLGHSFGFASGFLRGLGAPAYLYSRSSYDRPSERSDLERMRSDWRRIGGDFRTAVSRAHGEATASEHQAA